MHTKVAIVLLVWSHFNGTANGLRSLRQVPSDISVSNNLPPLGKIPSVVEFPCPMNYWIIYKDTLMKVSPTHAQSMDSSIEIDNTTTQSEMADYWLPTSATLTIMDPNQPEPLLILLISIRQDSLQYHTSVLIDSATTLNFVSQNFLT